jgi:hypothetical protein
MKCPLVCTLICNGENKHIVHVIPVEDVIVYPVSGIGEDGKPVDDESWQLNDPEGVEVEGDAYEVQECGRDLTLEQVRAMFAPPDPAEQLIDRLLTTEGRQP